jgi:hypothetical protein
MTERLIFVIGFCPGVQLEGGGIGGFEWRKTRKEAVARLGQLIAEDPDLGNDFILRAARVPESVNRFDKDAVTAWLDSDGFDLWNTKVQQDSLAVACHTPGCYLAVDSDGFCEAHGLPSEDDADRKCSHEETYCNDRSQTVCRNCGEELGR